MLHSLFTSHNKKHLLPLFSHEVLSFSVLFYGVNLKIPPL
jgi:hypothetical protein